ncbi:MAG: TIGR01777 family oxidoreductase [Flavobacteriaceae bacterium]|jgi:uncharacterized protein (TIGR01777 family)|nr:TIGR01777 family oxidoreductase [Flavobacteriaceae bacterium]
MAATILITGATGLVGKALTKHLLHKGYAIHILTTQKTLLGSDKKLQYFYWNPQVNEIDTSCFDGVEAVINLAGSSIAQRWTKSAKTSILNSRIQSLHVLSKAIKEGNFPINQLISASAIGIYSDSKTNYYEEEYVSAEDSSFLRSVVRAWESATTQFQEMGIKTTILRIGIVLDAKDGALPKIMAPIEKYCGAVLASGEQWQSWIHIDDLVALFTHTLELKLEGVYNAVAPNPVQQAELTKSIAQVLKRPVFLPNVPEFALKLLLGEMSAIVLESQRVCSKKIQNTGFKFNYHELSAALKNLLN